MGSEMCIRDSCSAGAGSWRAGPPPAQPTRADAAGGAAEAAGAAANGASGGWPFAPDGWRQLLAHSAAGIVHGAELWALSAEEREALSQLWVERRRRALLPTVRQLCDRYERLCVERSELDADVQLCVLRKQRVIGMTTTAVSKHATMLRLIGCEVLIVEEAAEVRAPRRATPRRARARA